MRHLCYIVSGKTPRGEYSSIGGSAVWRHRARSSSACRSLSLTRTGADRIPQMHVSELAQMPPGRSTSTSATKPGTASRSACRTGTSVAPRWRRTIPVLTLDKFHIGHSDRTPRARPRRSSTWRWRCNLFGDIPSDLGPGLYWHHRHRTQRQHQLRTATSRAWFRASARQCPGHGKCITRNPIGQIWCGAMPAWNGWLCVKQPRRHPAACEEEHCESSVRTPDLGADAAFRQWTGDSSPKSSPQG